jgi:hypothetical protein
VTTTAVKPEENAAKHEKKRCAHAESICHHNHVRTRIPIMRIRMTTISISISLALVFVLKQRRAPMVVDDIFSPPHSPSNEERKNKRGDLPGRSFPS